ncbi:MAG: FAD-linked oxidase C-terminal domain-containing protein [Desulfomonilaceae bacterium]|nr:FAD-linked oxidase C-terminal domain-containing protein [Desulfomonilaceae bacterium]
MRYEIIKELEGLVGPGRASYAPEDLAAYSYDAYTEECRPDIVLFPVSTDEVSAVMKTAYRETIPVTARGSGTNLAGESVPVRGGIAMCLTRMDKILSIDSQNLTATVQPGVVNMDLQQAAGKAGMMYPPDPASWAVATMGGTVGTNAGGPRTLKYGVTKDYLLGLTVVLADGAILQTGGRTIKNVTGYNLNGLFCGSEGTLGIFTQITVRLIPKPQAERTIRADFANLEDCSDAVSAIMASGIVPAALELMNRFAIRAVEKSFGLGLPVDMDGILLIQVDGNPTTLAGEVGHIERILRDTGAVNIITAEDPPDAERLWTARRYAGPALMRLRPNTITEDVTVPVSNLTAMIRKVVEICERHRIQVGVLAHAGDGNLHPCMVFDRRDEDEFKRVRMVCEDLVPEALALGGTLSGEHGIGIAKAPFLKLEMDPVALRVMQGIKDYFDPKGILNPGKFV